MSQSMGSFFDDGPVAPPLQQPVNIEGTDLSLATAILPAPPPLGFVRLPMNKRLGELAKRPLPSFLPPSDPSSTYATHHAVPVAVTISALADDVRPKRTATTTFPRPVISFQDTPMPVASTSRAVPTPQSTPVNTDGDINPLAKRPRGRPRKTDIASPAAEPILLPVPAEQHQPHQSVAPSPSPFRNDDICACCNIPHNESTASPLANFLYCDGCTRSFHMGCLNPPLVCALDVPREGDWFCPTCCAERAPAHRLPPDDGNPFALLKQHLDTPAGALPKAFSLPDEIRTFFKDVAVGRHGAYVDSGGQKQGRADRHGFLEARDPTRLKDRNNNLITCFKCGRSALPRPPSVQSSSASSSTPSPIRQDSPIMISSSPLSHPNTALYITDASPSPPPPPPPRAKSSAATSLSQIQMSPAHIISCDYCPLHWHLDCLSPPMVTMPSPLKKWMCPNHGEHVMPKRRTPKAQLPAMTARRGQWNNGNIEVIPSAEYDITRSSKGKSRERHEELWINDIKYLIPERTIQMDFLDRVGEIKRNTLNGEVEKDGEWRARVLRHLGGVGDDDKRSHSSSSPLTSLSSASSASEDSDSTHGMYLDELAEGTMRKLEKLYSRADGAIKMLEIYDQRLVGLQTVASSSTDPAGSSSPIGPSPSSTAPRESQRSTNGHYSPKRATVAPGSTATAFRLKGIRPKVDPPFSHMHAPLNIDNGNGNDSSISGIYANGNLQSHGLDGMGLSQQEVAEILRIRALIQSRTGTDNHRRIFEFLKSASH